MGSSSSAAALGSTPRTSTSAEAARDQEGDARGAPEPARTELVHERPGDCHSEPEDGVVRGHDHGEHASPKLVRGSALDEQRIADDGDAVAEAADEHSDHREHERRRHRRDPEADRHQRDRAGVAGPRPESIEQRGRRDAADRQAEARRSDEQAEAHVSRVERDLREHDLPDVDGGVAEKDDVPDDEDGEERSRPEHEADPVAEVLPVASALDRARLQPVRRDPEEEH